MSKRINEVNGVKLIKRYSIGSMLSSFLCFILLTTIVMFFFLPYMGLEYGGQIYNHTGKTLLESLFNHPYVDFDNIVTGITNNKQYIKQMYEIGLTISAILYIVAALFAIVLLFIGFEYLFRGRVNSYKAPKRLAWILTFVCFFPLLGYAIAFKYLFKNESNPQTDINILWTIILFSVAFLSSLALNIVYTSAFKNRVFVGDVYELRHDKGEQIIVDEEGHIVGKIPSENPVNISHEVVKPTPTEEKKTIYGLPRHTNYIGGHAFAENLKLDVAIIPETVKSLGVGAFANCLNLKMVSIPKTVKKISRNCFFNCAKLKRINYAGTKEQWRHIVRGSHWLSKAGTTQVVCLDGSILVDPYK